MRLFVRIVNRDTYTNLNKAMRYIERGLARIVTATDAGRVTEIHMLEAAEMAAARSALKQQRDHDPVTGKFEWFIGDSGGSQLMKQYEGISGGMRVYHAQHGN